MSDDDDFFGTNITPAAERPGGLVVGQRARQIFGPKGEVLFDELLELESEYRREGRPAITFEDGDDGPPTMRP